MKRLVIPYYSMIDACNDQFWRGMTAHQINSANWSLFPYCPEVSFKMAHNGQMLYIRYDVKEKHPVRAENTVDQSPVCQDSCVEFFITDSDGLYHNFECNAIGVIHAAKGKSRTDRVEKNPEEMQQIIRHTSKIVENNNLYHWSVIIGIPFATVGIARGKSYRANFYKCGDLTPKKHYLTWNKVVSKCPDFHCPNCFGIIELE